MNNKNQLKPIRVSFKHHERNIEQYIRKKGDYSNYIKDLVKKDMEQEKIRKDD